MERHHADRERASLCGIGRVAPSTLRREQRSNPGRAREYRDAASSAPMAAAGVKAETWHCTGATIAFNPEALLSNSQS